MKKLIVLFIITCSICSCENGYYQAQNELQTKQSELFTLLTERQDKIIEKQNEIIETQDRMYNNMVSLKNTLATEIGENRGRIIILEKEQQK